MTKVMCKIENDDTKMDGSIYFDCMNHAGKKDVCIICSTLCKVLLEAWKRADKGNCQISDGHVRFNIDDADGHLLETFTCVMEVFKEVSEEFPEYCKLY